MNFLKKLTAAGLSLALLAGTAACTGADKSWAAKNDSLTVPIGAYIYYEYLAYQDASSKVKDSSKPVLEQTVENKDAATWIKDKAVDYTKLLLAADKKMKDLKLSLTEDEKKQITSDTSSQWSQYQSTLEGYGVSKESFGLASVEFSEKYSKIFSAIYGKNGTNPVSDADLKSYFEKNFTDFSYVMIPLYDTKTYAALDDAKIKEYKKLGDDYAAQLSKGTTTVDKVGEAVKQKLSLDAAPSQSATDVIDDSSGYPADMVKLIQGMKAGEAKTIEITDANAYLIVMKHDVTKKTQSQLSTDNGRLSVLNRMKSKEFTDMLESEAKNLKNVQLNDKALNAYPPKLFVPKDTASAAG